MAGAWVLALIYSSSSFRVEFELSRATVRTDSIHSRE